MKIKRAFIIDFACCIPFGHNLFSVNLFYEKVSRMGFEAKAVVCKRIRKYQYVASPHFDFELPFLYKGIVIDITKYRLIRLFYALLRMVESLRIGKTSMLSSKAMLASKRLFKKYQFTSEDIIILPSADFYGTKAILKQLGKLAVEKRPKLHLRFIGVLEHAQVYTRNSVYELVKLINTYHETVTVSAEVAIYARYLNLLLPHHDVIASPYPVLEGNIPSTVYEKTEDSVFSILLPGTNRIEKGYYDIFNITKELLFQFPDIEVVVQDMKKWDKHFNGKYRKKLKRLANVTLIDAILPRKELDKLYDKANAILLPYDPIIYEFRGSGVHYEAIQRSIPVLVNKGVGFVGEVQDWSSGWTYETKEELYAHISHIRTMSKNEVQAMMDNAFVKFKQCSDEAYRISLS